MAPSVPRLLAVPILLAVAGCAAAGTPPSAMAPPGGADTAGALAAHHDWWRAFSVGDTAHLQARTAAVFSVTMSNGLTYDRAGTMARAATHANGGRLRLDWAEEAVRPAGPGAAIATSRVTETDGPRVIVFRYLTVLERDGDGWRASAAQSTREAAATPRVSAAEAGPPADYAGSYRTPRGGVVRIVVRDSALGLVEPSGAELPLVPIGPAVFEFHGPQSINGIIRFVFVRDAAGRVTSLVRLALGEASRWSRTP